MTKTKNRLAKSKQVTRAALLSKQANLRYKSHQNADPLEKHLDDIINSVPKDGRYTQLTIDKELKDFYSSAAKQLLITEKKLFYYALIYIVNHFYDQKIYKNYTLGFFAFLQSFKDYRVFSNAVMISSNILTRKYNQPKKRLQLYIPYLPLVYATIIKKRYNVPTNLFIEYLLCEFKDLLISNQIDLNQITFFNDSDNYCEVTNE